MPPFTTVPSRVSPPGTTPGVTRRTPKGHRPALHRPRSPSEPPYRQRLPLPTCSAQESSKSSKEGKKPSHHAHSSPRAPGFRTTATQQAAKGSRPPASRCQLSPPRHRLPPPLPPKQPPAAARAAGSSAARPGSSCTQMLRGRAVVTTWSELWLKCSCREVKQSKSRHFCCFDYLKEVTQNLVCLH